MSRKALLVATADYADADLPALGSPVADLRSFAKLLEDSDVGHFDEVKVLADWESARVRTEMERLFVQSTRDDTVLLYVSGHGIRSQSDRLYFAMCDTRKSLLQSSAISATMVRELIADSDARAKLIMLDCCYSGAFAPGMAPMGDGGVVDLERHISGRGTYVITASTALQKAFEVKAPGTDGASSSVFTRLLVAGLDTGAADFDGDGEIHADELFRYVKSEMSGRPFGQTPTAYMNIEEPILVARARRDRTGLDGIWPAARLGEAAENLPTLGDVLGPISAGERGMLANDWAGNGKLMVPLAMSVERNNQVGSPLHVKLGGRTGHVAVVGGVQAGKTTFLKTLILSLALTHTPDEVQFYCLDPGGNSFARVGKLPHVIETTTGRDGGAEKLVREIELRLAERQRAFRRLEIDNVDALRAVRATMPQRRWELADVFLVVDGWEDLAVAQNSPLRRLSLMLAKQGLSYGFHLAVSTQSPRELPEELASKIHARFELRLDDPASSWVDPARAERLPHDVPGWGLTQDGVRFIVARPEFELVEAGGQGSDSLVQQILASYADVSTANGLTVGQKPEPLALQTRFAELMGIGDPAAFDARRAWRRRSPQDRLRVPIGVDEYGEPVVLDIKEAAMGGMGPHGLCVGATGSGKSELLRTLVLALAVTHSSENLNFVLCDFKGGATFAGMAGMPHTAAVITNLADDLTMVDRMGDAIVGEMNRRQEILRDGGNFKNIHDYEQARAAGAALPPMPNLVIVLDEFSELLSAKPEFLDLFTQIGRIGRSLGLHLLLSSQRLEESKLRGLDTYLSYRLGLKTFSAAESRVVLGVPDAFTLPPIPGSGYLKTASPQEGDNPAGTLFKAAYVSDPYEQPVHAASADDQSVANVPTVDTVLDVLVRQMEGQGPLAHQVWLPPLHVPPTLDRLMPGLRATPLRGLGATLYPGAGRLVVPIAIEDKPLAQKREPYQIDFASAAGHAIVVGGPRAGKSTLVRTMLMGLALGHTPQEVQFFCLDFGGGSLSGLAGLPHTSCIGGRLDSDVVRRVVSEVVSILDKREESFRRHGIDSISVFRARRVRGELPDEPFGDVFLVIDGWHTLRSNFEVLEQDVLDIAQRGPGFGVHVIVTAARWAEIRPQLKDAITTRIELRLGDPMESEIDRKVAVNVPAGAPGRGLTRSKLHFLAALPRIDGVEDATDLADGVAKAVHAIADAWQGPTAPKLRMLPLMVPYTDLPAPAARERQSVPLGVDETKLEPVYLDFNADPHFLLFGEGESGKTSTLRALAQGISEAYTPQQARILAVDYRRTLLGSIPESHQLAYCAAGPAVQSVLSEVKPFLEKRLPGSDVTAEQLRTRSWWTGPEIFVMVDDYDLVATPGGNSLLPLLEYLPLARDIGLHLIIARASGGAGRALFDPLIQRLRETRQPGLLLSGERDEGQLIGRVRPSQQPPGRGTLVSRKHGTILVQTAYIRPPT